MEHERLVPKFNPGSKGKKGQRRGMKIKVAAKTIKFGKKRQGWAGTEARPTSKDTTTNYELQAVLSD